MDTKDFKKKKKVNLVGYKLNIQINKKYKDKKLYRKSSRKQM